MTRDEAVARIQQELSFRTSGDAIVVTALQDTQVELEQEQEIPYFLITEISSQDTVDGEERVKLPAAIDDGSRKFIREVEDGALFYFNGSATEPGDKWTELAKDDLDVLRELYPGEGAPKAYALDGLYFRIFPTPDDIYTLKMRFYATDVKLTTNIENRWLEFLPTLMIGVAGQRVARPLRDKDALREFKLMENEARVKMILFTEARIHENRRYVMGGQDA
jgi:hypothetical protein